MNPTRKEIVEMVRSTRKEAAWIAEGMPSVAVTAGQKALQKKHGTPLKFAKGLIELIGEISILEAQTAAEKYKREWARA